MSSDYNVKLPTFEGPLDLLLHLIKVNELEITEISISQITSQYLDTLKLLETLDLDVAGDFLVMAASLINIKLRSILPDPEEEIEEEAESEGDDYLSARALMQRLIEYRRFKEAALNLGGMAERRALVFVREVALPTLNQAQADPGVRGDLGLLLEAFSRVVKFVSRRNFHEVQSEEFNVDDKIALVRRRIVMESRISIDELFAMCQVKIEMIVTLIALLELCRLKELRISQVDSYGSIVAFPRRAGDDDPVDDTAREAEELRRLEAEILASRTGLVDNSPPPMDEEDALLAELFKEAEPAPRPASTPGEGAAAEPDTATEVLEAEEDSEAETKATGEEGADESAGKAPKEPAEELEGGARVEEIDFAGTDACAQRPAAAAEDSDSQEPDAAQDTADTNEERIEALENLDAQALLEAEEKIEAAETLEIEAAERVESPYELEAAAPASEHEAEAADAGARPAAFAEDGLDAAALASGEPEPEEQPETEPQPVEEPVPVEEPAREPAEAPEEEPQPEEPAIEPSPEEEPQPEEPAIEPAPEQEPEPEEEPVIEPEDEPAPAPEPEAFPAEPIPPVTPDDAPLEVTEYAPAELPETEVRSGEEEDVEDEVEEDEEDEALEDDAPEAPRPVNLLENWDQFDSDEPPVDEWHPGADFKPEYPDPFDEDLDDEDEAQAEDDFDDEAEEADAYSWETADDVVIEADEPEEESEIVECAGEESEAFTIAADEEPEPVAEMDLPDESSGPETTETNENFEPVGMPEPEAEPAAETAAEPVPSDDPIAESEAEQAHVSETHAPEPVDPEFAVTDDSEMISTPEPEEEPVSEYPSSAVESPAELPEENTAEEPELITAPEAEPNPEIDEPAKTCIASVDEPLEDVVASEPAQDAVSETANYAEPENEPATECILGATVVEPELVADAAPEPDVVSECNTTALPEPAVEESVPAGVVEAALTIEADAAPADVHDMPDFNSEIPESHDDLETVAVCETLDADEAPAEPAEPAEEPAACLDAEDDTGDALAAPDEVEPLLHVARYRIARVRGAGQTARAHKAGNGRTTKAHRAGAGRPGRIRRVKLRQPWAPGERTTNLFYDLCLARGGERSAPLDAATAQPPAVAGVRDLVSAGLDRGLRRGIGCGAMLLLIFLIAGGTYVVATRSHHEQPAAATLDPPRQDLATPGQPGAAGPERQS